MKKILISVLALGMFVNVLATDNLECKEHWDMLVYNTQKYVVNLQAEDYYSGYHYLKNTRKNCLEIKMFDCIVNEKLKKGYEEFCNLEQKDKSIKELEAYLGI